MQNPLELTYNFFQISDLPPGDLFENNEITPCR